MAAHPNPKFETIEAGYDAARGTAAYTPLTLAFYDFAVLSFSNSFVWRCSSRSILNLYNEHVSNKHLDVGVGTGYFLDRCRFSSNTPTIALLDLNRHCLEAAANRLRRFGPSCHCGNVLDPIDIGLSGFASVGINYLLHCLPGDLKSKSVVFAHLKPLLEPGGVLFGSTILGEGVQPNFLAQKLMRTYNAKGIFSNSGDRLDDLETGLKAHFVDIEIKVEGCVARFTARKGGPFVKGYLPR